jgi:hypothetical protein
MGKYGSGSGTNNVYIAGGEKQNSDYDGEAEKKGRWNSVA